MVRKFISSALACLAISTLAYADEQILEILNDTFPLPNENAAQVNIRNHADFDVICNVKVAAKIQGKHPATGLILTATSDSDPVVGFILKANRDQFRKFDFNKAVTQLRQVWGDPQAIVTEVDNRSIISDCKRLEGSTNETPTLKSLGYAVDNKKHPRPSGFDQQMSRGVRITPDEHDCYWLKNTHIYAFPDGVVYTSSGEPNYHVYDLGTVRSYGCKIPSINGQTMGGMIVEPTGNTYHQGNNIHYAPSLKSLGYAVDGRQYQRGPNFLKDMALALRVEPKDHACAWAVRPLIYVFPDGVVYARASTQGGFSSKDYNVYTYQQVWSHGCFIPPVAPVNSNNSW